VPTSPRSASEREIRLDEDHQRFAKYAVIRHRLGRTGACMAALKVSMSATSMRTATWVGFCGSTDVDVGHVEVPKELLPLGRSKPIILVLHIVVTDDGRNPASWVRRARWRKASDAWPSTPFTSSTNPVVVARFPASQRSEVLGTVRFVGAGSGVLRR
jgi:hypothetical protein